MSVFIGYLDILNALSVGYRIGRVLRDAELAYLSWLGARLRAGRAPLNKIPKYSTRCFLAPFLSFGAHKIELLIEPCVANK